MQVQGKLPSKAAELLGRAESFGGVTSQAAERRKASLDWVCLILGQGLRLGLWLQACANVVADLAPSKIESWYEARQPVELGWFPAHHTSIDGSEILEKQDEPCRRFQSYISLALP